MMRRIVIRGTGGPEVLHLVEGPTPAPRRGQVRVRVEAAGVAAGDVMRRLGGLAPPWPFTPGYDIVGVIEAVGAGVEPGVCGQRVAAMMAATGFGGYASHVLLRAGEYVAVPDGIEPVQAVGLGLNYITALQVFDRVIGVEAGQRVLVHGAAGGVGTATLQLGRHLGLELFGTASARKHPMVEKYGAVPIDYRTEDFVARIEAVGGVDAVLDPIGGDHLRRSHSVLRPGGTLVAFGASGDLSRGTWGVVASFFPWAALRLAPAGRRVRMYTIHKTRGCALADCHRDWADLLQLHRQGVVAPHIGQILPLEEAAAAHDLLDRAAVVGKIVLTVAH